MLSVAMVVVVCLLALSGVLGGLLLRSRQMLARAVRRADEVDRVKADFLSSVSHELRTPMTSIKGYVDNMLDGIAGPVNDRQRQYLRRVKVNADRLTSLINDLVDLSRIDRGRLDLLEIGTSRFDVSDLVLEVASEVAPILDRKGLALRLDTEEAWLFADRARVRQILLHLVGNAARFTEAGEVRVTVRCRSDRRAEVEVADTGVGIPDELKGRVFDRFVQGDDRDIPTGPGLGLSIAREFADILGGDLKVRDNRPAGTVFTLSLPLSVAGSLHAEVV